MLEDYLYERKLDAAMGVKQSSHFTEEVGKEHEWEEVMDGEDDDEEGTD